MGLLLFTSMLWFNVSIPENKKYNLSVSLHLFEYLLLLEGEFG
jgi:hypothetical protein